MEKGKTFLKEISSERNVKKNQNLFWIKDKIIWDLL